MPTSATASDNAVSLTYALPPQVQIIYALPPQTRENCCILLFFRRGKIVVKPARAESARAFTGRRCPHSGKGEDFLTGKPDFFTETAVTPKRKVEKSFPRWEFSRHAEG